MNPDDRIPARRVQPGWERPQNRNGCGKLFLLAVIAGFIALPFTPWAKVKEVVQAARGGTHVEEKIVEKEKLVEKERLVEKEKVVVQQAPPPPLPDKFVPAKEMNVATLFNEITIKNEIETVQGDFASKERLNKDAYTVSFKVSIRVPKPNSTVEELGKLNPHLAKALPGLGLMIPKAKVSGFYHHLYEQKEKSVQMNLTRVDKLLSRHNFFDLETALELEHPETKQKALLIQGEMDVVSDGSDGDRMPSFDDYIAKSSTFQPVTSYFWKKLTDKPNPLLARYEGKLQDAKEKAKNGTREEKRAAASQANQNTLYISDLKSKSFLIAQEDPFIVISLAMRNYAGINAYAPSLGDYAVVIHENKLLPAIVGDYGPREKMGEASLRIAKEINPKSTPYNRPESELKVTYIIFPGSAEKPWAQPNLAKWGEKCTELIGKLGGVGTGYAIHQWVDNFAKPPTPPPVPPTTPTPTVTPGATPAPVEAPAGAAAAPKPQ